MKAVRLSGSVRIYIFRVTMALSSKTKRLKSSLSSRSGVVLECFELGPLRGRYRDTENPVRKVHRLGCPDSGVSLRLINRYREGFPNEDVYPLQRVLEKGCGACGTSGHRHAGESHPGREWQLIEISLQSGSYFTETNLAEFEVDRSREHCVGTGVEQDGFDFSGIRLCVVKVFDRRLPLVPSDFGVGGNPGLYSRAPFEEIVGSDKVGTDLLTREVTLWAAGFGHHDCSQ